MFAHLRDILWNRRTKFIEVLKSRDCVSVVSGQNQDKYWETNKIILSKWFAYFHVEDSQDQREQILMVLNLISNIVASNKAVLPD